MEAYSLNTHILPGNPVPHHEHRKMTTIFVIVLAIGALLSLWYLWVMRTKQTVPSNQNEVLHARITELMQQAPIHASKAEIDQMTNLLMQSNSKPPNINRAAIANLME